MMRSSRAALCAIMIISLGILAPSGIAWGARSDMELDSLRGLGGIYLIVQPPSSEMTLDGLNKETIKTAAQLQINAAGIKTLAKSEDLGKDTAILVIALSSVKSGKTGLYACSIDAQLIQITSLARNPEMLVPATTWTSGVVAIVDGKNITEVNKRVTQLVDEFISDFKLANLAMTGEIRAT